MKSKLLFVLLAYATILACLLLVLRLYPDFGPFGSVALSLDASEARGRAMDIAHGLGLDFKDEDALPASLQQNEGLINAAAQSPHEGPVSRMLRSQVPAYNWEISIMSEGKGGESTKQLRQKSDLKPGEVKIKLDGRGNLLQFERSYSDSIEGASLAPEAAFALADSLRRRLTSEGRDFPLTQQKHIQQNRRTDHEYTWTPSKVALPKPASISMTIAGDKLVRFAIDYPEVPPASSFANVRGIVDAVILLVFGVIVIVVAFRRARSYELSFRFASVLGLIVGVLLALEIYAEMVGSSWLEAAFPVLIGCLFGGGAFILLWAVAESVGREVWPEKFTSLDLVINGYFLHSRVGTSVLQGIMAGTAAAALCLGLSAAVQLFVPGSAILGDHESLNVFASSVPALAVLGRSIPGALYRVAAFLVLLLALLRPRIPYTLPLVVIGALVFSSLLGMEFIPAGFEVAVMFFTVTLLVWFFLRADVLAAFVAAAVFGLLGGAPALFTAGAASLAYQAAGLLVVLGIVVVFAAVAVLTSDASVNLEEITPAFVRFITERQRLQRELEIARDVQRSFLPKKDPVIAGVEIASRCVPAQEVGGDYYDFLPLGDGRFGVAIGDVSGKGTQAAFFMTLTKGFLRAVTRICESPAEVLSKLNDLFCENVDRGAFISMIYAVVDVTHGTVTLARAGHNPALIRRAESVDVLPVQQPGLALGLEPGARFAATIREETICFDPGDVLVFYTDGFTEAMNRAEEELGDDRFRKAIAEATDTSAKDVLEQLFEAVRKHTGKAPQHDDMTMVVVRRV